MESVATAPKIRSYRDLEVWQPAMQLTNFIYQCTENFPKHELYGLAQQMRRCSVSIASNIAEGSARQGTRELIHFLYIAKGSCSELETQVMIARMRSFIEAGEEEHALAQCARIAGKLMRLIQSLSKP